MSSPKGVAGVGTPVLSCTYTTTKGNKMFITAKINSNPKVHYCYADETGITGTVCKSRGFYRMYSETEEPATCARCVKAAS